MNVVEISFNGSFVISRLKICDRIYLWSFWNLYIYYKIYEIDPPTPPKKNKKNKNVYIYKIVFYGCICPVLFHKTYMLRYE